MVIYFIILKFLDRKKSIFIIYLIFVINHGLTTMACGPNPTCFLFLCDPWTKNDFYVFKCKKDHKPFHESNCSIVEDTVAWPARPHICLTCLFAEKRLPTPIVNYTKYSECIITFNIHSIPRMQAHCFPKFTDERK